MKITGRQREFLSKFLKLCSEANGYIHYTDLAKELGVSKYTAYDMLRLLEKKELVSHKYLLDYKKGKGRSKVLFYPFPKARELLGEILGEDIENNRWKDFKELMLKEVDKGKRKSYIRLLKRISKKSDGIKRPMEYCTYYMMSLFLGIKKIKNEFLKNELIKNLKKFTKISKLKISSLAGMILGTFQLDEDLNIDNEHFLNNFLIYQEYLNKMSSENRDEFDSFVEEIFSKIFA
jgi:DNA-binding MarR family transcriptional regulator